MTQEVNQQIRGAVGAHAVYLAVKNDDQLQDAFMVSEDGALMFNKSRMLDMDYAQILIYLSGKYELQPNDFELRSGILAAATKQPTPKRKRGGKLAPRPEMVSAIEVWLNGCPPSMDNHEITTEAIGEQLFTKNWTKRQRRTEMEIGAALGSLGFKRYRICVNNERKWRWYMT